MASHIIRVHVQLGKPFLLLIGCWLLLSVPASAQGVGNGAKVRMQEMDKRELQLNNPGGSSRRPSDSRRSQAMMDQVDEDFQRILTLHNEMVRAIAANKSLSYQFISDAAGEIRKRSARLQSSLNLHGSEPAAGNRGPGDDLKSMETDLKSMETKDELILLCRRIESFIKNPIIETPGTVNAQQLDKARRDLESVVKLSGVIKKHADKQNH